MQTILDEKSKISELVKGVRLSPMNVPLWIKLSKYPIDENVIKVENKFRRLNASDNGFVFGNELWTCKKRSIRLKIG